MPKKDKKTKGFLSRAAADEPPEGSGDQENLYRELFPKIGRDFVYKEDLKRMLGDMLLLVDPFGLNPIATERNAEAKKRALEYKALLDSGEDAPNRYKDLINLDDDDDDEEESKGEKKERKKKEDEDPMETFGDI